MDKDIQAAVNYLMDLFANKEVPADAVRVLVEERVRMAIADGLRWQAGAIQSAASNLTMRKG